VQPNCNSVIPTNGFVLAPLRSRTLLAALSGVTSTRLGFQGRTLTDWGRRIKNSTKASFPPKMQDLTLCSPCPSVGPDSENDKCLHGYPRSQSRGVYAVVCLVARTQRMRCAWVMILSHHACRLQPALISLPLGSWGRCSFGNVGFPIVFHSCFSIKDCTANHSSAGSPPSTSQCANFSYQPVLVTT
jgi:hypothetical protein